MRMPLIVYNMKELKLIGFLFSVLFFINTVKATDNTVNRDSLWYLCGDYELITDYEFMADSSIIVYRNQKGKYKEVETYYCFSLNKSNGEVTVLYRPTMDKEEGDTLTIEEMEAFVIGGYLGKMESKAPLASLESFAIGMATPFVVASASVNPFFSIIIPALNSTFIGATNPRVKKIKKKYPELSKNPLFIEGYRESAKRKRTKNSIVGGFVGMLTGIATVFIIISR